LKRRVLDGELRVWEAFPNPEPHASGGLHRIVFRCLSDPRLPVRVTQPLKPEALQTLLGKAGLLSDVLGEAKPLD
jgi:hypothetical protein